MGKKKKKVSIHDISSLYLHLPNTLSWRILATCIFWVFSKLYWIHLLLSPLDLVNFQHPQRLAVSCSIAQIPVTWRITLFVCFEFGFCSLICCLLLTLGRERKRLLPFPNALAIPPSYFWFHRLKHKTAQMLRLHFLLSSQLLSQLFLIFRGPFWLYWALSWHFHSSIYHNLKVLLMGSNDRPYCFMCEVQVTLHVPLKKIICEEFHLFFLHSVLWCSAISSINPCLNSVVAHIISSGNFSYFLWVIYEYGPSTNPCRISLIIIIHFMS